MWQPSKTTFTIADLMLSVLVHHYQAHSFSLDLENCCLSTDDMILMGKLLNKAPFLISLNVLNDYDNYDEL